MKTTTLFASAALAAMFALAGCPKKSPDEKKADPQTKVIDEAKPTEAKPAETKPEEKKVEEKKVEEKKAEDVPAK